MSQGHARPAEAFRPCGSERLQFSMSLTSALPEKPGKFSNGGRGRACRDGRAGSWGPLGDSVRVLIAR